MKKTFLVSLVLLMTVLSCKKEKAHNLVLITLDTQRADHISAYDTRSSPTPFIDSLASEGLLYENCYSPIPITLPAHGTIFYSLPPHKLKLYNNGEQLFADNMTSLTEIIKDKGYTTAAFVSLGVLKQKFGLNKGFDLYDDNFLESRWYLFAEEINQKVLPWIETHKNERFFLWVHYQDPHGPYAPPGSPPDLKITCNNEPAGEFCLNYYQKEEIPLVLNRGENIIRFEVFNPLNAGEESYHARFDILEFVSGPDSEPLEYTMLGGDDWLRRGGKKEINFYLKKEAALKVTSPRNKLPVRFRFRGRLKYGPDGSRAMYRKEVEYMDSEVGKLFTKLKDAGLWNKTSIMVVGDHGEGLGEYRSPAGLHFGHIHFLYDVYVRVPLIIYNPINGKKGLKTSSPVTLVDVAPTLLGLMGWKKENQMQGRNLLKIKDSKTEHPPLYGETYTPESFFDRFSILQYPWHMIMVPRRNRIELYNLETDPAEKNNVYEEQSSKKEITDLRKKITQYAREALTNKSTQELDDETLEMLKSLGYLR